MRKDRNFDQLRDVVFETNVNLHAEGSCLVKFGNTHVICTASIDEKTPPWLRNSGKGWVTAEYGMLPRSTNTRIDREATRGKQSGRTQEIQRLIGRSLRSVTNLEDLGERQIKIDCDVLVCGDKKESREEVIGLINTIGMKGWHAGVLANSAAVEAMTSVLISINKHHSISDSGIKVTGLKD